MRQLAHNVHWIAEVYKTWTPGFCLRPTGLVAIVVMHLYPELEKTGFEQPSFESLTPESMPFIDAPS